MGEYNRFSLENGLRVVHHHDPHTAMIGINVMYNVGARDDARDRTGMAHLFEHLMFGGSANIPSFDAAIENAGGMNNAWTSADYTSFYSNAPAVNAETLFWLESDRMLALNFSQEALDVQRSVVIEEFKQTCLNRPYGLMSHRMLAMLYRTHPYRVPVIGADISHLERVTLDDIRAFFHAHYAPNNAVLSIDGNISLEEAKRLTHKWFDDIPYREIAPRLWKPEEPIEGVRHEEMKGIGPQVQVVTAFAMPGNDHPDFIPADLISDVLASGRSSRMFRELTLEGSLFSNADASVSGTAEPGFFRLSGMLLKDGKEDVAEAEARLLEQVERIKNFGVSDRELQCAINRFESKQRVGALSYLTRCQTGAIDEMEGREPGELIEKYRAITLDDIKRAATNIFDLNRRVTLVHRPES